MMLSHAINFLDNEIQESLTRESCVISALTAEKQEGTAHLTNICKGTTFGVGSYWTESDKAIVGTRIIKVKTFDEKCY